MLTISVMSFVAAALIAVPALARRNSNRMLDLNIAIGFVVYPVIFGNAMVLCEGIHPQVYDGLLYHADRSLGLNVFPWMHVVWSHHWLWVLMLGIYVSLPLLIAVGWMLERSFTMLRAVSIAPVLALVFYNIVPAIGPIYAFADTSGTLLPMNALTHIPRNCFPSMHMSWALLVALNAQNRKWKIVAYICTLLTCMSALGAGEHYYVDLIAAVPFCFAVQCIARDPIKSWVPARFRRSGAREVSPSLE